MLSQCRVWTGATAYSQREPGYTAVSLIYFISTEELALTLNGKKRKNKPKDFDAVLSSLKILDGRSIENLYQKFSSTIEKWIQYIQQSFLPEGLKDTYRFLVKEKASKLNL